MDPTPHLFTADEASALLPTVRSLIEQLQGLRASLAKTEQELEALRVKLSAGNGYPIDELRKQERKLADHQLDLAQAFQSAAEQFETIGCILKDLDQGLVDFYSLRDGDLVFLCWKFGEEGVQFWHGVDDGFAGRRAIE